MASGRGIPDYGLNEDLSQDQCEADKVITNDEGIDSSHGEGVNNSDEVDTDDGSKSISSQQGGSSKDFEKFTKEVESLLEYLGWKLEDFRSEMEKVSDKHGREAVKKELIKRLIEKDGDASTALLTVVGGKIKGDPKQHLLKTQSMVLNFVNALLHENAKPSFKNNEKTPIHHAIDRGFRDVSKRLLEVDDSEANSLLPLALKKKDDKTAALIIKGMPKEDVREVFLARPDREKADSSFALDVVGEEMTDTGLQVLGKMFDYDHKGLEEKLGIKLLTADAQGRSREHPNFSFWEFTAFDLIALTKNKDLVRHDIVKSMIRRKWKGLTSKIFTLKFCGFLLSVVFMTFAAISGVMTSDPTSYDSSLDHARAICELFALICVFIKGCAEIYEMYRSGMYYVKDITNYVDCASILCVFAVVPLRWTGNSEQWQMFAVGYLIWIFDIFKYAVISRRTYDYSQTLKRLVYSVFPQFTAVFLVVLVAFSGSFLMALRGENALNVHDETNNYWKILYTGARMLIEGEAVVDYAGPDGYKVMSTILMTAFLFVTIVVLLNILIAQLTDTYKKMEENMEGDFLLARLLFINKFEDSRLSNRFDNKDNKYDDLDLDSESDEYYYEVVKNVMETNVEEIKEKLSSTQLDIKSLNSKLTNVDSTLKNVDLTLNHMQETLMDITKRLELKHN